MVNSGGTQKKKETVVGSIKKLQILDAHLLFRQVNLGAGDQSTGEKPSYCEERIFSTRAGPLLTELYCDFTVKYTHKVSERRKLLHLAHPKSSYVLG